MGNSRIFVLFSVVFVLFGPGSFLGPARAEDPAMQSTTGPMIGHVSPTSAIVWLRSGQAGEHRLVVSPRRGAPVFEDAATALDADDLTVRWRVGGLEPGTEYTYSFLLPDGSTRTDDDFVFRTPLDPATPQRVTLAFGALADSTPSPVWTRMLAERVDGLVLLGDAPFVDTSDLDAARRAHRAFLAVPEVSRLIRRTPVWATWNDHDFGQAGADGNFAGKVNARVAFTEYRALDQFGREEEGIYTSFRLGPVEVFLLDTRSFMNVEPSPVASTEGTMLGHEQWRWITQALNSSDAPFKLVCSGALWDSRYDGSTDDWATYYPELDIMLFQVRQAETPGVVLLSGELGIARAMRFPMTEIAGYDIWQFNPGALGDRAEPLLRQPHTATVHQASAGGTFLRLTADSTVTPAELTATWIRADGERLFSVSMTADDLTPKSPPPNFGAPVHEHDHDG